MVAGTGRQCGWFGGHAFAVRERGLHACHPSLAAVVACRTCQTPRTPCLPTTFPPLYLPACPCLLPQHAFPQPSPCPSPTFTPSFVAAFSHCGWVGSWVGWTASVSSLLLFVSRLFWHFTHGSHFFILVRDTFLIFLHFYTHALAFYRHGIFCFHAACDARFVPVGGTCTLPFSSYLFYLFSYLSISHYYHHHFLSFHACRLYIFTIYYTFAYPLLFLCYAYLYHASTYLHQSLPHLPPTYHYIL